MLFRWLEQKGDERIRPLSVSERTLYRKPSCFKEEGTESLPAFTPTRRHVLPLAIHRMILDPKAERSALDAIEIATLCYAHSGRKPARTCLPSLVRSRREVARYRG